VGNNGIGAVDPDGRWALTAFFEGVLAGAEVALNNCDGCPQECHACCDAAGATGAAALAGAYASAMASCVPFFALGPWGGGGCMAAATVIMAAQSYNLGKDIEGCHDSCPDQLP
jgi:hypothetical protein